VVAGWFAWWDGIMGLVRYAAMRVVSGFIVLIVVTIIISALFSKVAEEQLYTQIEEKVRAELRQDPTLLTLSAEERVAWQQQRKQALIKAYGLDKPYFQRVMSRAIDVLQFRFGRSNIITSITGSRDVRTIIFEFIPRSILLFTSAAIIYVIIGILVGIKAAQKAGTTLDRGISVLALLSASLPMWWVGMLMILAFAYSLDWFPSSSMPFPQTTGIDYYLGVLHRMTLPLVTIVMVHIGGWAYVSRNLVIGVLQEDFVMAARAKGVPESRVIYGHVLRAAAPPILTMTIFTMLASLGGAIITEAVFNWPGMGRLYWTAIQQWDVPVIVGLTYFSVFLYIFSMVLADLLYGYLDPRVKVGVSERV